MKEGLYNICTTGMAFASAFIIQSLEHLIPWLIVMFFIIFTDFMSAIFKCIKTNEAIRISKGVRDTMAKSVTYFSFVVTSVFIDTAMKGQFEIDKWAILIICLFEGCSIVNNILKTKGLELNFNEVAKAVGKKLGISIDDDIIKKD